MDTQFDSRLNRVRYIIHPGEFHATSDPVIISTVLGSCVAVVLYDEVNKIGGMNHFLLPGSVDRAHLYSTSEGRYGIFAMELLINQMIKIGANRSNLQAKVFGGGHMFVYKENEGSSHKISENNAEFAFNYLQTENIPLVAHDVGGTHARKVLFLPDTFQVFQKTIRRSDEAAKIKKEENTFLTNVRKKSIKEKPTGNVELF